MFSRMNSNGIPMDYRSQQQEIPDGPTVYAVNNNRPQPPPLESSEKEDPADLKAFAARKTVTGGALGMGLIASNIDQLLTIVVDNKRLTYRTLNGLEVTKVVLLILSLTVQIVAMTLMTVLGSVGKTTKVNKKKHNRVNTATMILSFITTLLNVAITSFNGHGGDEP